MELKGHQLKVQNIRVKLEQLKVMRRLKRLILLLPLLVKKKKRRRVKQRKVRPLRKRVNM